MKSLITALAFSALAATTALAQPDVRTLAPGKTQPAATLADAAWLAGRWVGEGLGGQAEETYSGPADGAMVGHFHSTRAGKAFFYEFMVLAERNGSLVYRLKHYWPDGRPWEEKDQWVEFPLVALARDRLFFDGCTFERTAPDAMLVHVRIADRATGRTRVETFTYRKVG
jgi:hypothetical protein